MTNPVLLADKFRDELTSFITKTKVEKGSEVAIEQFVTQTLIEVTALATTVFADGRLTFSELTQVVSFVSGKVRDSLDIYSDANQTEKLKVVAVIVRFLLKQFVTVKNPVVDFVTKDGVLETFIDLVYKLLVKR